MATKRPDWLTISELELVLPRLAPVFGGYRLVQISDIHFGTWINRERLQAAVELVNSLEPDTIAITGDFVDRDPGRYARELVAGLSELRATEGVIAVLGNHDHWTDARVVTDVIAASGICNLSNHVMTIKRQGSNLHFAGVDCYFEGKDRLDMVLDRLPAQGAAILLAHEPDFADISAATGRFDLQISGHSHGGQMILPWIGPPLRVRHAHRYPLGKYQINGMIHYTNRGLGTSHIPLRINCPAEVTVFTLRTPDRVQG